MSLLLAYLELEPMIKRYSADSALNMFFDYDEIEKQG